MRAEWGRRWITVTAIAESREGPVHCHWEGYSDNFDEPITRESLIIEEASVRILEKKAISSSQVSE